MNFHSKTWRNGYQRVQFLRRREDYYRYWHGHVVKKEKNEWMRKMYLYFFSEIIFCEKFEISTYFPIGLRLWVVPACSGFFLGCSSLFWVVLGLFGLFWVVLGLFGLFWVVPSFSNDVKKPCLDQKIQCLVSKYSYFLCIFWHKIFRAFSYVPKCYFKIIKSGA